MTESTEEPQATSIPSEADSDFTGESAAPDDSSLAGADTDADTDADKDTDKDSDADSDRIGVADADLPDDLQPGEDNPLAEPLDPDAEETKDAEELGMKDTQDNTSGTYRSEGDLESSDSTSADSEDPENADTDSAASASDAAQSDS